MKFKSNYNVQPVPSKKQGGFTLVELMIGTAVIALAVAGIYAGFADVSDSGKTQEFQRLHKNLVSKVQTFYGPDFNYSSITTAAMVDGKIVPEVMRRGTGSTASIAVPYGSVTGSILTDSARTDLWAVQYVGMPSKSCSNDVKAVVQDSLRVEIGAAAGSLTTVKDLTSDPAVPFNQATLAATCGGLSGTYTLKTTQR